MREGSSESTTTIIPTEYGPLVLARTVTFGREDDDTVRPRGRGPASGRDDRRPPERA